MNIGGFTCRYGMGGSRNSAITLCNALAERGHRVTLYCPAKQMFSHVRPKVDICEIPVNEFDPLHFRNISISNAITIAREMRRRKHDVLLSFNHASLIMLMPQILRTGTPCVQYVLGPIAPLILRLHGGAIVANSDETRDILAEALSRPVEDIAVVRGRVSIDVLENDLCETRGVNPFHPPPQIRQISMMSRLDAAQIESIYQAVRAVAIMAQTRRDFRFLLAGTGAYLSEIRLAIEKMNKSAGRQVATAVGYVGHVGHFIQAADMFIGMGRCAFEAMAFGKPTLIVGQHGFAGTVVPEEIDELAYCNFAGRNVKEMQSPDVLAERLAAMLDSPEHSAESGRFARSYYRNNLDAGVGARQLEHVLRLALHSPESSRLQQVTHWLGYIIFCCAWVTKGLLSRLLLPARRQSQLDSIRNLQRNAESCSVTSDFQGTLG